MIGRFKRIIPIISGGLFGRNLINWLISPLPEDVLRGSVLRAYFVY